MILCLGCDVALTLHLKSVEVLPSKRLDVSKREYNPWWNISVSTSTEPYAAEDEEELEEETLPVSLLKASSSNDNAEASGFHKKAKASKKDDKSTFILTLMHGDMAVLFGDGFDYSIKRDGTSIRDYPTYLLFLSILIIPSQ
ncbi:hypothetical protein CPB84DRAFT_143707 [Gymnopilus junonius]|uniref:Uncharacterized protein n=1 Tax=Gymnopilus junonius TaxID=109634 RepID=A0A9P5NFU5_GYMJU|nr:hypothetical protein CPB84DRAFT_143707 [Gymnopilus junonius]